MDLTKLQIPINISNRKAMKYCKTNTNYSMKLKSAGSLTNTSYLIHMPSLRSDQT